MLYYYNLNGRIACSELDSLPYPQIEAPEKCNELYFLFRRPAADLVTKYNLANSYDDRFGGPLSHVVVMQHVRKETIDRFIRDLQTH